MFLFWYVDLHACPEHGLYKTASLIGLNGSISSMTVIVTRHQDYMWHYHGGQHDMYSNTFDPDQMCLIENNIIITIFLIYKLFIRRITHINLPILGPI